MQVQLIPFRKKISTLLTLATLKWETFASDVFLGSLPSVTCRHFSVQARAVDNVRSLLVRKAWGRGKGFRLFAFPSNKECRQLWNSTVNR